MKMFWEWKRRWGAEASGVNAGGCGWQAGEKMNSSDAIAMMLESAWTLLIVIVARLAATFELTPRRSEEKY
jgi:hypothetical protein